MCACVCVCVHAVGTPRCSVRPQAITRARASPTFLADACFRPSSHPAEKCHLLTVLTVWPIRCKAVDGPASAVFQGAGLLARATRAASVGWAALEKSNKGLRGA